MVLLSAVILGCLVGWGVARAKKGRYQAPGLNHIWLVVAAFLPQLAIAYVPSAQPIVPDWLSSIVLVASLVVFLAFVWLNRRLPGMPVLMTGLVLNLLVIASNGGWMPISPDTASHLRGGDSLQTADLGRRFGQKDVLLLPQDTHLAPLADRFLLPAASPYQTAFSPGDILVAIGVFWLLARPSTDPEISTE